MPTNSHDDVAESRSKSILWDSSALQRACLLTESNNLAWVTISIIAITHAFLGCFGYVFGSQLMMALNLGFSLLFGGLAFWTWRVTPSRPVMFLVAALILIAAGFFILVFPGPMVIFVYTLAPIPAFRVLGMRYGFIFTIAFVGIVAGGLFFTQEAAEMLRFGARANTLIGFILAGCFGCGFEWMRQKSNAELKESLQNLRILHGLIPICCVCHKVRHEEDSWQQIETLLRSEGFAEFSHGYCVECLESAIDS